MRIEANLPNNLANNTSNSSAALSRPGFAKALEQVQPANVKVIQAGDTLTSIVKEQAQLQGVKLTPSEEFRWAQNLATDSGIQNPNAIFPGQKIQLQNMLSQWQTGQTQPQNLAQTSPKGTPAIAQNKVETVTVTASRSVPTLPKSNYINAVAHPVLSQTLDRAVNRGFIPKVEKQDVYNKVLQVANKHNFSPDDFARLTLMESDGMNPQATNTRCHGIIQFCDGPARGAAEVGFGQSPKSILGLSVYQQLHLVDTYFEKVGLKKEGAVPLDELYLAVLQPAARGEKRPQEPLGIPGKQAKYLYEGRDPQAPMTRSSITQGLMQNAADRLGFKNFRSNANSVPVSSTVNTSSAPTNHNTFNTAMNSATNPALNPASDSHPNSTARIRLQVQKAADYDALEAPKTWLR
ncbi:MAG: LysM domain-containing protein [Burkholderiales bacterium]|nr:LysM domain-containing protein [Burkholderiales bacterium]